MLVEAVRQIVSDGRGQLLAIADSTGDINSTYAGNSFTPGPWLSAGLTNRQQTFTPRRWAADTGAIGSVSTFRNRQYDPSTGRWLQEDPAGMAGGVNLYQYNGNNPASLSDPFGLDPCKDSPSWTECLAQALANFGARQGGALGSIALNAGAALNAGLEATGINAAASAGNDIGSGRIAKGLLGAAALVVPVRGASGFVTAAEESAVGAAGNTLEVIARQSIGGDAGRSAHIIERDAIGRAISVTHRVIGETGGILHQHQTFIGRFGTEGRKFPNEWSLFPDIGHP